MLAKSWPTEGFNITEKIIDGIPIKVYADRLLSLREVLRRAVSSAPEKTALVYQGYKMTYREFGDRAARVSGALQRLCAVKKGDRVALLFSNTLEFSLMVESLRKIVALSG